MNQQELIQALEESRERFLDIIEGLPDEAWVEAGVSGEWSVKDILAHLSRCEAELIRLLYQAERGLVPTTVHTSAISVDEQNEKWYRESKDRPLERILADFEGVREQTIRRVQALSDHDLSDPKRHAWLEGEPLAKWIANESVEHEAEHGAQIREWRAKRNL